MFTTSPEKLTDAEIAADIATCEDILRTGSVNGILLDGDCEATYRDWLSDLRDEKSIREHAADFRPTATVSVRRAA